MTSGPVGPEVIFCRFPDTPVALKVKGDFNYDSGEYEDIDCDGVSWTRGEYTYNWDESEYRREEEEERQRMLDDDLW